MAKMLGVMWEWDHMRYLSWEEYQYWLLHPLPFGWGIILVPDPPLRPCAGETAK